MPTNKFMKHLLLYIFLIFFTFQTPSQADDIRDFQIEGISVGDSLLDYFSEEKIINSNMHYGYADNKFYAVGFSLEDFYKTYESIEIHLKTDDKKYKIYAIDGIIFYDKIKDCYKKKDEIERELSEIFKDSKKVDAGIKKLAGDKSGKSTVEQIYWILDSGDIVGLECYDWSKEIETKEKWYDNLRVSFVKKKFNNWLRTKAY